ncbi:MAG: glucosamine-6-phosphate deaminase, partial [Rubripirellula sp.]
MITKPNERISCRIFERASDASAAAAADIADLIRLKASQNQNAVLGLVVGSSPVNIYGELVRLHRAGELSFANVVTFNSDEYHPMQPVELQSVSRFMHEHLFDHVDIDPANIHLLDGTVSKENAALHCAQYEQMIRDAGGIDVQLLGVNRAGHIGLNEPGSDRSSRTRLITLDESTRTEAASDFFGAENVPRHAITMGIETILSAKRILLVAMGEGKADIAARVVEGFASANVPATFLQDHPSAEILLDQAAASGLARFATPWLIGDVTWDDTTTRRAVIDLSEGVGKSLLKLTDADYNEHGLQDLLAAHGSSYDINLRVFRHLQSTITGWPGGKPEHRKRPGDRPGHRDDIFPKRVILF